MPAFDLEDLMGRLRRDRANAHTHDNALLLWLLMAIQRPWLPFLCGIVASMPFAFIVLLIVEDEPLHKILLLSLVVSLFFGFGCAGSMTQVLKPPGYVRLRSTAICLTLLVTVWFVAVDGYVILQDFLESPVPTSLGLLIILLVLYNCSLGCIRVFAAALMSLVPRLRGSIVDMEIHI
jgi:hypothetical protein